MSDVEIFSVCRYDYDHISVTSNPVTAVYTYSGGVATDNGPAERQWDDLGTVTATVTITDTVTGATASDTLTHTIYADPAEAPVVEIYDPDPEGTYTEGIAVEYSASMSGGYGDDTYTILWEFDDDTTATTATTSKTWSTSGQHSATCTFTGEKSLLSGYDTLEITVGPLTPSHLYGGELTGVVYTDLLVPGTMYVDIAGVITGIMVANIFPGMDFSSYSQDFAGVADYLNVTIFGQGASEYITASYDSENNRFVIETIPTTETVGLAKISEAYGTTLPALFKLTTATGATLD